MKYIIQKWSETEKNMYSESDNWIPDEESELPVNNAIRTGRPAIYVNSNYHRNSGMDFNWRKNEASYNDIDCNSSNNNTSLEIDKRYIGRIIGKDGSTIRNIQETSGAKLKIHKESDSHNISIIEIFGPTDAKDRAAAAINEILNSQSFDRTSNKVAHTNDSEELYVPQNSVRKIIGRGGCTIKDLQTKSGCVIKITKEMNCYDETLVHLIGAEDKINKAKELSNVNPLKVTSTLTEPEEPEHIIDWNAIIQQSEEYSANRWKKAPPIEKNLKKELGNVNPLKVTSTRTEPEEPEHIIDWDAIRQQSEEYSANRWKKAPPIKKKFYIEDPEVAHMCPSEVSQFRKLNNNIVVQRLDDRDDDDVPNPVITFEHAFKHYPEIMDEIHKQGFEKPTPIQCQSWPIVLQGSDMIGISQTGSGKTIAFLLPALLHIENQVTPRQLRKGPSTLIMAPTRELAQQIEREAKKYQYKGIKSICLYGGGNRREQIYNIEKGAEIVIATPGRLNDLVMNNFLDLSDVTFLVLDEADRMLDMGFEPQIKKVLLNVRPDRQTIMTSATWPECVRQLGMEYTTNPIIVFIGTLDLAACHTVKQKIRIVKETAKRDIVYQFIDQMGPNDKAIIFVGRKCTADDLARDVALIGIDCQSIHGDREQEDRESALEDLRNGIVRILVATDVASRGLDIPDITHIFNYDFPRNVEEYVHRIGRTGRAGRSGTSITLVTDQDWKHTRELINIMEEANQVVPARLYKMADRYESWVARKKEAGIWKGDRKRYRNSRGRQPSENV